LKYKIGLTISLPNFCNIKPEISECSSWAEAEAVIQDYVEILRSRGVTVDDSVIRVVNVEKR